MRRLSAVVPAVQLAMGATAAMAAVAMIPFLVIGAIVAGLTCVFFVHLVTCARGAETQLVFI